MKFFHIAISVKNLEESKKFYESVFGLKYRSEGKREDLKIKFVNLEDENGGTIELIEHESPLPAKDDPMDFRITGLKHIAFVVENIETAIERAASHGAKIIRPAQKGATVKRNAFVSDPDGVPVELVEPFDGRFKEGKISM